MIAPRNAPSPVFDAFWTLYRARRFVIESPTAMDEESLKEQFQYESEEYLEGIKRKEGVRHSQR
jgi:hypothetical protein